MGLSKEEKKAIELLKKLQKKTPYIIWGDGTPYNKSNQIQTILNVIDEQQKEIKELKEKDRHLEIDKSQLKAYMETCCINKTKIEKKIEELKEIADEDNPDVYIKIDAYEELLEEN